MRLRADSTAASPLVVIATFVLFAILVTAGAYWLFLDRPDPALGLVEQRGNEGLGFNVTQVRGGLQWGDLKVRFLDPAGADLAGSFVHIPDGSVTRGDVLRVQPQPASGTYLLLVTHEGQELVRLAVVL